MVAFPSRLRPKNWKRFQHYTNRRPPWIKLHREMLNDRAFMTLALASRGLAPLLWLLASESEDGSFSGDLSDLEFRLHVSRNELTRCLESLLQSGFIEPADSVLAPCRQVAPESCSEGEGETERETEGAAAPTPPRKPRILRPEDVPEQVWTDWLETRKGKRAAVTETAIKHIRAEAGKIGLGLADALQHATAQGWQGFRAAWVKDAVPTVQRNAPLPIKGPVPVIHESGNPNCQCDRCISHRRRDISELASKLAKEKAQ